MICSLGSLTAFAGSDDVTVVVKGTYAYQPYNSALKEINRIRLEACKEGLIIPGYENGLKLSDYRPLKWSYEMETIAQLRAAEASVYTDHTRPNGKRWFTAVGHGGHTSGGENLYWESTGAPRRNNMDIAIAEWYSEKNLVKKGTKDFNENIQWKDPKAGHTKMDIGHYLNLIEPRFAYVGIATFVNSNKNMTLQTCTAQELYYSKEFFPNMDILPNSSAAVSRNKYEEVPIEFNTNLEGIEKGRLGISGGGQVRVGQNRQLKVSDISFQWKNLLNEVDRFSFAVKDANPSWNSSNTKIAEVDQSGRVTGRGNGSANIMASIGKFTGKTSVGTGTWKKIKGGYWTFGFGNSLVKNESLEINGNTYYFNGKGIMNTGWNKEGSYWRYYNKKGEGVEGAMVKDTWKKINGKWYYFYEDGKMAADTTIGTWYVNKSGAWTVDQWKKSSGRYWYAYKEGGYAKNEFVAINGNQYAFDGKGWMMTGWINSGGNWYYANKRGQGVEGAMVSNGWKKVGGKWYYFYEDGKMAADTTIGTWYVNKSGAWSVDRWVKSRGRYWYALKEGGYPKDEIRLINGNGYYFDRSGWMKTGWLYSSDGWRYFNKKGEGVEGAMVSSQKRVIGGKLYHFNQHGVLISEEAFVS